MENQVGLKVTNKFSTLIGDFRVVVAEYGKILYQGFVLTDTNMIDMTKIFTTRQEAWDEAITCTKNNLVGKSLR